MATYYIAPPPTGSDSTGTGSISAPWATLQKGMTSMTSGDTLMVRAGTYTEAISSNHFTLPTGTSYANAPRIVAYPGSSPYESVILNGTNDGPINLAHDYIQYMIFEGFVIDGQNTDTPVSTFGAPDHIRFLNCEMKNGGSATIGANGVFLNTNAVFFEIISCKVHNNSGHGFYISSSDNLVDKCEIYTNGGFQTSGNNHWGIQLYHSVDPTNTNRNIVRNNRIYGHTLETGAGGVTCRGDSNLIYNNLIYSNVNGIVPLANQTNTKVYNNTVYNNSNYGIQVQGGTGAIVQNNIFYSNFVNEDYLVSTTHDHNLTTDPHFLNAAGNDFHLTASSTGAIDQGTTV